MTSRPPLLACLKGTPATRRTSLVLLVALVILVAVAGTVWAARGATLPTGLFSRTGLQATSTPTRTPRPVTATPTIAPVNLTIVLPTATPEPTAVATVALAVSAPAQPTLPGWLAPVVERYGMDATRRFVVVDLASQQMIVWDPGQEIRTMLVSTGDESRGYRTLAWYGLVGDYWGTFNAFGVYADEGWYLFEDAGHILIHGSPYKLVKGEKVYEEMEALGAYPASKGCIRLTPQDAEWFTTWNPKGVPIVILPKDEGMGAG
jgi:lipoprotein-anchoring transpeptidase ErfK/SrfK